MKVIIVGCGKLGSGAAYDLAKKGNQVTVIDTDPETFHMLGKDFPGELIVGVGFDKKVLEQAHIERVDALVACTKSDETNALIGKVARDIYRVPRVISRLYDPRKAEIYRSLGIQTISITTWGVQRISEMLSFHQLDSIMSIGGVELIRMEVPALLVGKTVDELTSIGEFHVVTIVRKNRSFLPTTGTSFEKHDIVYMAVANSAAARLKSRLNLQ